MKAPILGRQRYPSHRPIDIGENTRITRSRSSALIVVLARSPRPRLVLGDGVDAKGANFLPPNWRCSRMSCLCVISSSLLQKRLPRSGVPAGSRTRLRLGWSGASSSFRRCFSRSPAAWRKADNVGSVCAT